MRKRVHAVAGLAVLASLLAFSQEPKPADNQQTRTLEVQLDYAGTGTVDQSHKVFVVLWDSPDFLKGESMPILIKSAAAKDAVVPFTDVQKGPVYVSVAYDPSGSWDGASGPPPAGTSLGLYHKDGAPVPIDIAEGKTVRIKVTFDDSMKMQ